MTLASMLACVTVLSGAAVTAAYAQDDPRANSAALPSQAGHPSHGQQLPDTPLPPSAPTPHPAGQGHEGHTILPAGPPPANVPPVTDEDRRAAFPDVEGHTVHDTGVHYFVLFDQFELQTGGPSPGLNLDNKSWIGGDLNRVWFRAETETEGSDVGSAQAHALYGRAIARWWDLVAGVRQDMSPGPGQTWAAVGIQGLAPYWFEVEATAYVGAEGRTHLRFETEYELLLTNRLVLQPLLELELYGKSIPESGIGSGLSTTELGARLRYEIRRELAPYVGVTWTRRYGGTADFARDRDEDVSAARLALGLRMWF
jgi:copper resistance protein B